MRRKNKIILAFSVTLIILCILLVFCWKCWTPAMIGNKYRLEDVEKGHAVLVVKNEFALEYIVVGSTGKWKYYNLYKTVTDEEVAWYRKIESRPIQEKGDKILENNQIPYQKGRINKQLLKWAINVESVQLEGNVDVEEIYNPTPKEGYPPSDIYGSPIAYCYYAMPPNQEDEEGVFIGRGGQENVVCGVKDIRIMLIRAKLEKLQEEVGMCMSE